MTLLTGLFLLSACSGQEEIPLYKKMDPSHTGITFNNTIITTDSLNFINFPLLYNGGGVAVGDINNDGLPDIYLTGNLVSSRLYLNRGNMRVEDITEAAGVGTNQWASGASMVDPTGNGWRIQFGRHQLYYPHSFS